MRVISAASNAEPKTSVSLYTPASTADIHCHITSVNLATQSIFILIANNVYCKSNDIGILLTRSRTMFSYSHSHSASWNNTHKWKDICWRQIKAEFTNVIINVTLVWITLVIKTNLCADYNMRHKAFSKTWTDKPLTCSSLPRLDFERFDCINIVKNKSSFIQFNILSDKNLHIWHCNFKPLRISYSRKSAVLFTTDIK